LTPFFTGMNSHFTSVLRCDCHLEFKFTLVGYSMI
jgi:hypothetical protein